MSVFHLEGELIEESGKRYSVNDLLNWGEDLFAQILPRRLTLLLCRNEIESVLFYINALNKGVVPILMDAETDIELIAKMINTYEPSYIFGPADLINKFPGFTIKKNLNQYILGVNTDYIGAEMPEELALLLSTSGSTGSPKLVRLSLNNITSNADSIIEYLKLNPNEKAITNLPMNYSFGLSIINSHLRVGAKVLLTKESVIQRKFWDLFRSNNITSLSGVPYTFEILKKMKFLNMELPSLRTITQAGGKLSNDLIQLFAEYSNNHNISFYVMYGQTEATARLSYLEPDQCLKKLGSIGKAIPKGKFYLVDESGKQILSPEEKGELKYEGPNVMLGYAESKQDLLKGDELNKSLSTGDLAYYDTDGYYFITGRLKRFIKLFGNRINLDELEQLLKTIGVENACTGNDNKLIIYILKEGQTETVKTYISKHLGIHFSGFSIRLIESIPKNPSGKTLYSNLASE